MTFNSEIAFNTEEAKKRFDNDKNKIKAEYEEEKLIKVEVKQEEVKPSKLSKGKS